MAFRSAGIPMDEIQFLERMRAEDPESAANVVANGKLLVEYAQHGNLKALQCALDHMQEDRVLMFYSTRTFRAACQTRRVDILRFMLAHGFDVTQVAMRDVLHCIIEEIAGDEQHEDDAAQPLLRFLMDAGVDVNWQRSTDLFTALHVACRKSLYAIAYLLILYGADVNAIAMAPNGALFASLSRAQNDEMPLACAVAPKDASPFALNQHVLLVTLLEEHNARRMWRKSREPSEVSSDTAATTKGPRDSAAVVIRSFSGSRSAWQRMAAQRGAESVVHDARTAATAPEDAPLAAVACGITLDMPPVSDAWYHLRSPSKRRSTLLLDDGLDGNPAKRFRAVPHSQPKKNNEKSYQAGKATASPSVSARSPRVPSRPSRPSRPFRETRAMTRNSGTRGGETGSSSSTSLSASSNLIPTSEPTLTLAAIAQVLQDAAHFADQYGSSAAARERLELLEREQEGLNDMIVLLRTRLRQAQRATAAAETDARHHKAALISAKAIATIAGVSDANGAAAATTTIAGEKPAVAVDPEAFVDFLKRKFACRGDMALLQDALLEFQLQQGFESQQPQTRERVVLLTIEEVETSFPRSSAAASSYNVSMSPAPANPPHMDSTASITVTTGANDAGSDSSMALGLISSSHTFYRQSAEEEEQEIHLAAKQLLSPVTFAHVDEDEDESKAQSLPQPPSLPAQRTFVPILAHEKQQHDPSTLKPSVPLRVSPHELDGNDQKLKKLLPKKPRVKKTSRTPSPSSPAGASAASISSSAKKAVAAAVHHTESDTKEPTVQSEPVSKKRKINAAEESLVIKQNLVWPAERRNITEMKHSSRFLSLRALEELDRQTPWNEMYKRRPLFSHILNYQELDERAKAWFVSTLKIQFIWRRELWERLHWLPMSESVCTGAAWEKYRQTRKRRAKHAVTAWRKIYAQSIQMIEAGILPDDIWCDPALWYMPANPIYWLPESDDVAAELLAIDDKHAVRCYHVYDLARHPFYEQRLVDKYPHRYELPSFSPSTTSASAREGGEGSSTKTQGEELLDETPAPAGLPLPDAAQPPPAMLPAGPKMKLLATKDAAPSVKKQRGPRPQKVASQQKLLGCVTIKKTMPATKEDIAKAS